MARTYCARLLLHVAWALGLVISVSTSPTASTSPPPAPSLSPPVPTQSPSPEEAYGALAKNLPPAGQFRLMPGSSVNDVLVKSNEFEFCEDIRCFSAKNAFLAWVGMAFDEASGRWWNPAGGGHADYGGNEIYRFDFNSLKWSRLTDPEPLTGPFIVDRDKDGVADACPRPVAGPPATHSYDGALYVPSTDEVLVVGTVPFCVGAMANVEEGWVWSNANSHWRKLSSLIWSRYMRTAYDAARDRVYMVGGQGQGQFYELDPHRNYSVVREAPLGWSGTGVAEFHESSRYLYYSASKIGIFRVHVGLDGTLGQRETVTSWTDSRLLPIAIHEPTGQLVTWAGDAQVLRTDPATGVTEDVTPQSGPVPTRRNGVIYSKWVYIPSVDAFVGVDDAREGVWVFRLPDSGATVPRPAPLPPAQTPPTPPSPSPPAEPSPKASSFDERCNAAEVVFCDPLDTEGPWGVDASGTRRLMPNPDGSTGIPTTPWWRNWRGIQNSSAASKPGHVLPRLDTVVKASGTGSLKFDYPRFSGSGGGGNFATNFSDDLSQQFGEGDAFYVQYRWRANCDFIYTDCNPESPGYKKTRRAFRTAAGGTTAAKLSIIADGDPAIGESSDACTWLQIVTVHGFDHVLKGFHSCGWYRGFDEPTGTKPFGSTQIDFQPNGDYDCWYVPDESSPNKHTWGNTGPNCWSLESDEWVTIQVMIRVGRWQPDRTGEKTSHVTIWAAREGEPQRVVIDHDLYLRGPNTPSGKYGKVWLLPFMTGKDDTEDHPTGNVWFDELIVSTRFVPDPS